MTSLAGNGAMKFSWGRAAHSLALKNVMKLSMAVFVRWVLDKPKKDTVTPGRATPQRHKISSTDRPKPGVPIINTKRENYVNQTRIAVLGDGGDQG